MGIERCIRNGSAEKGDRKPQVHTSNLGRALLVGFLEACVVLPHPPLLQIEPLSDVA